MVTRKTTERVAGWLATRIRKGQEAFASFMTRRTARLSKGAQQAGLLLFCLLFGGASFLAFWSAFQKEPHPQWKSQPLTLPRYFNQPGDAGTPALTRKDQQQVRQLRKYMDSLYTYDRRRYDSLNRLRPGLLDSLRELGALIDSPLK